MAKVTIEIPDEIGQDMQEFEIEVAPALRESIKREIVRLIALKTIAAKSKLTSRDALELGKTLKKGRHAELQRRGLI